MKGRAVLLVAATVAVLLAGCGDDPPPAGTDPDGGDGEDHLGTSGAPLPPPPQPAVVGPAELESGHYYAFRHSGGDLALAMAEDGTADLVLFGADDGRIGRIALAGRAGDADGGDGGGAGGRFVLDGIPAGELVVQAVDVEGRLDLRSDGVRVGAFERLPSHVERHVLLQQPLGPLGAWGLPPLEAQPADEHVGVELRRAPSALRALLVGSVQGLTVELRSRAGPVLEAQEPGSPFGFGFASPGGMYELPAEVHEQNVRDGRLEGLVSADHFEGVLLLEAESFSRARPPASGGVPTTDGVRFTYGVLPDQPVSFRVRSGADRLFLFHELTEGEEACLDEAEDAEGREACEPAEALVQLFGPRDERVATVRVPWNRTMAVPVHASGAWVAVLLAGQASLGADRAPSDFELHPLDVRAVTGPAQAASGEDGQYGQATASIDPAGVAFRVTAAVESAGDVFEPGSFLGAAQCGPSTVAALQDAETIGAWSDDRTFGAAWNGDDGEASLLLDGGKLTLVHDDFGPSCPRTVVLVEGYVR